MRIEFAKTRFQIGDGKCRRDGSHARSDRGAVSGDLRPQKLSRLCQTEVRADDEQALDDFVTSHLDFVDQ